MKDNEDESLQIEQGGEAPAAAEDVDARAAARDAEAEPEDYEVPPSGVLPPDPTGLGALA